jgi:hypothetical protein
MQNKRLVVLACHPFLHTTSKNRQESQKVSTSPYFDAFFGPPTLRSCPRCKQEKRLYLFRRWRGTKRILHDTCNACDPEKRLSEMTADERLRAADADRPGVRLLVVQQMNQRERDHVRFSVRPERAMQQRRKARRAAWNAAITQRVRDEMEWAARCQRTAEGYPPEYGPAWVAFFQTYTETLRSLLDTLNAKVYLSGTPIKPTMEDCDPAKHPLPRSAAPDLITLRRLYAACTPMPGRRLFRDPWCLTWGEDA